MSLPPIKPGPAPKSPLDTFKRRLAPTDAELEKYPSLKHAWEEYLLIRKLVIPEEQPYSGITVESKGRILTSRLPSTKSRFDKFLSMYYWLAPIVMLTILVVVIVHIVFF